MITANQVVKAALQEILVQAAEQPISPDQFQDAIFYLNNYMAELASDGITLGYTDVENASDQITIPRGAISGVISNLAVQLAAQYDVAVSPDLAARAQRGLTIMSKIVALDDDMIFPDTLPIGSGNERPSTNNATFFGDFREEEPIEGEQNDFISTE